MGFMVALGLISVIMGKICKTKKQTNSYCETTNDPYMSACRKSLMPCVYGAFTEVEREAVIAQDGVQELRRMENMRLTKVDHKQIMNEIENECPEDLLL